MESSKNINSKNINSKKMTYKNQLYIVFLLCCSLLSAGVKKSSNVKTANLKVGTEVSISKDSLRIKKEKDSTKIQRKSKAHWAHLEQMVTLRGENAPLASSFFVSEEETQRKFFPDLDTKISESKSFAVSFARQTPEFDQEFITSNFAKNKVADKYIEKAKKAFEEVKKLKNFAEIITGKELLKLPVGLRKKDSTSGNTVELAIVSVKFTPQYAEFKAWAKMIIPAQESDGSGEKVIYFGAENIKLSHDGALLDGGMRLVLLGNQHIPINGNNWLLTLKGGIDLKTGVFGDQSFVEFDCTGLKSIALNGDLRVSRNVLLPIDENGEYACGSAAKPFTKENSEKAIGNKCYVGTSFNIKANGWNDLLMEVSLPSFEVVGLKGWGFNIKNAVLDLSDTKNSPNLKLPEDYDRIYPENARKLWRGFYAKEVEIVLPKGVENTKKNDKRVRFSAEHLILDSQGISGEFRAKNILSVGEGTAGKWAFTIEDVGILLSRNQLKGGSIGGEIAVPIFEEPMDYKGYIHPDGYGLEVGLQKEYKTPVFLGEMQLERNSSVAINVKDGKVYPYANLTGKLSIMGKINQKKEDVPAAATDTTKVDDKKGFNFKGITFQELELQTEPGKKFIQAKSFGYEGEMKLMNFPVSVGDLKMINADNNTVGLSFDLKINLDKSGVNSSTNLSILGKLEDGASMQKWQFEKVKVNAIAIDYTKANFKIAGSLEIMTDDPIYGDGFSGEVTATFNELKFSATGKAMFGKTDFRYWVVDIWTDTKKGKGSKFLISSFVGGISNRMTKVSGNKTGFDPGSAIYKPDADTGLGVRAGVKIGSENSTTFKAKAYLEMEFNKNGGLNRIGFIGEGAMMSKDSGGGSSTKSDFGKLNKTFDKINDFYEKNKDKVDKLSKYGNFLGVSKEAIPVHDVAASGAIGVFVGIEKDFKNDTFKGEFELYMDLKGVKGGGDNNLAGYASLYSSPTDWHIYIGTPQKRIDLLFSIGVQLRVGGYFMTGTDLPTQLNPHPMVVKILGDDILNGNRKENQLTKGKGFAFGMNFAYGYGFDYLIFYANVELGAGFDVMHAHYKNTKCKGRSGPVGNDGWYSMGQVYAYLYGEFGVKVNLTFIKGKFVIAEAGVAANLRGQFPNPVYFTGYVGMYYRILGGLVSGRMRLKVEMGEECKFEGIAQSVGVPIISDITPNDKKDDVSVFTAPQVVFNYAANKDFRVDTDGATKTFKLQLKTFTVTSEGKELKGSLEWNDTNDAVTFKPKETLPSEKEVKVVVEVSFDEKIGGAYLTVMEDGKPVLERKEISFTTDIAPDHIPLENIVYTYPVIGQQSFYPEEYNKGYVKLKTEQNYLFKGEYEMRAEFISPSSGQGIRTNLYYDQSKGTIFYDVPKEMALSTQYGINLVVFPPGADIQTEIVVEQSTEILKGEEEGGNTNWFNPSSGKQENMNTSASSSISNKKASKVTLSNGAPKSILEYNFKTSVHPSFKDKVRSIKITNSLTNFVYADVHSLSVKVEDYEYFDKMEILGDKYTGSQPLIYPQAILNDRYYKIKIYPLLYESYPLDGNIRFDRKVDVLGVPPVRSFYIGNEYLTNIENNASSSWVKNRIPFVYNMPYQYKKDLMYLRREFLRRYGDSDGNTEKYENYKYLLDVFPPLPLGNYDAQLIYQTPGKLYQKGYKIRYKNK